jgi:tRNA A-37 threonylcarbamoyl transferase component Bud32/tetratricopeptide (TPR) repeat protein
MKPERIGKYEIVAKIGQGAMGEVFRAHDPVLNRAVAVKRISAGLDTDENVKKRFQREAQSAALLSHPNIITVYELGMEGEQLFMAMELLDGIDLKHALTRRKMSLDEKVDVIEQICEGLAFAHAHEIVHRDLKPANIHILPGGKVKIMDFGLARLSTSEMTSTGMVMGTPHYMSPEQVRGQKADSRSDIFALGCVFYEILTGHKPFDAESLHAVLYKVMQEEPPSLREAASDVPEAILQVVDKALAKNPAERFQNASDMLAGLRQARQAVAAGRGHERVPGLDRTPGAPATREPVPVAPPRQRAASERSHSHSRHPARASTNRGNLLIGLVLGLAVVGVGAWALQRFVLSRPAPAPSEAPEVSNLAKALIDNQIELAQRRLDSGDFTDAVRVAERALKLDPQSEGAKRVFEEATTTLKQIDAAVAALGPARGDNERLADAALALMQLDPDHPEAGKAATAAGAAFNSRATQARQQEQAARQAAEQAGAARRPAFGEAADQERQGDKALDAGQAVTAARRFLRARRLFEQAARKEP